MNDNSNDISATLPDEIHQSIIIEVRATAEFGVSVGNWFENQKHEMEEEEEENRCVGVGYCASRTRSRNHTRFYAVYVSL